MRGGKRRKENQGGRRQPLDDRPLNRNRGERGGCPGGKKRRGRFWNPYERFRGLNAGRGKEEEKTEPAAKS